MNRFRKKPDARNVSRQNDAPPGVLSSAPPSQQYFQQHQLQLPQLALPTITSADDFRSSVIIPDLGKRFSILNRNGILAADRIRSKLAQQRAVGDENRITEEEEDFLMHALSSLQITRSNNSSISSAPPGETSFPASVNSRPSFHSAFSTAELTSTSLYPMSALSPSTLTPQEPPYAANGTPRSNKRTSNNLFGSGQFRDRSYIRAAKSTNGNRSPASPIRAGAERTHYGSSELEQFAQIDETSEVEHSPGLVEEDQIRLQVPPVVVDDKAGYIASGSEGSSGSGSGTSDRRVLPGTELTVAQARRMSRALERALSSISSDDENGDLMDDETILAPPLARSFPRGSNGNQNHSPLLPSQQHHPDPHPLQQQQPQWQQELENLSQNLSQNQNQTVRTEDIRAMLSYLSQTDIGLRALRETPELAEIINNTTYTTTTTTYLPPSHQQPPFRESEIELDSDSAASASSSSNSPHPPRNATASPVPDSSQRVPGYVPGMHRPITPQFFGNGITSGTGGEFDSDDYSTTPRATSPANMVRRERSERERAGSPALGGISMRPGIAVREGGSVRGIVMEGSSSIEGVLSGERDRRRGLDSPQLALGDLARRRPASPLSQVHTAPSAPISRPSTGGSTSAQVNVNLSHPNTNANANTRIPDATHSPSSSRSESNYSSNHSHHRNGSSSSSDLDQEHEQDHGITEAYAGGSGLTRSKSIASRSIASPALPESPLIDGERNMTGYFHAGSGSQSWDNSSIKSMSPISVGPALLYKNATAGGSRPSTPNIQRPTTPGLGGQRSSTPVSAAGTAIARSPTPNYLLQRSPSAAGYHSEHDRPGSAMGTTRGQHHAHAHSNSIRTTPSHTSSSSASNPLLQSSLDNSSRSSLESVGSSYHSSDGETEDKKAKMLMTLLFEPDSERAKLVRKRLEGLTGSSSSFGGPGEVKKANGFSFMNGGGGERDENGHSQPKGSDSPISALGDQEDTLQLLTGLTKKDVATIQQKLVSAYVTREAENALKTSQRRRRPSVQSRDFATSPTPRPAANVTTTNSAPSVAPSADVTTQQPAPPGPSSSTSTTSASPVKGTPSPPAPVIVPQSGRETPVKVEDQQSGSIPSPTAAVVDFSTANSAPDSRPPSDSDHAQKDVSQAIPQGQSPSPRARALAEALFGSGEPSPVSTNAARPRSASLSNSPDAPETPFVAHVTQPKSEGNLEKDVERKAAAATAALKNSSEASSLVLRRKPTKKIQTSQISGPQLLSASMSVDAIPLASPVSTLVPASPATYQDASSGSNRASGRGLLGRWRSLRKSQQSGMLEPIETVSSTLARQDSVSPGGQTIVYHPTTMHTPEIQSVPPPGTTSSSPPQHQWPQSAGPTQTMPIASPPATSGGLKGFMTRLRQSKGSARKEEAKGSPATPSVALQNAAATPPHLQRDLQRSPSYQSHNQSSMHPLFQRIRGATSGSASPPIVATPPEEEEAVAAFRQAAKSLGLEEEMINGFLLQRSNSTTRAGSSDVPRHEGANSPFVAPSPPSRQLSTRAKPVEATVNPRTRVTRDGVDPLSAVVRRTIIFPSNSASAFSSSSNIMAEGRIASPSPVLRKSSSRRRPPSATSQHSTKSPITDRVPTPPPPRGGRRFSEDNRPPLPSLPGTNSHHLTPTNQSSQSGGYESPTSSRPSIDNPGIDPNDGSNMRGVGIEVAELANGEVIWSVLDTLRGTHAPLDVEDDDSSLYFRDRLSVISHYTEPSEEVQMTFKQALLSPSRGAAHPSSKATADSSRPETKVFYSDAKDITRLIEQITSGADSGSFNLVPKPPSRAGGGSFSTMHTTRTEDLPVEDQLDRLIQRVSVQDSPQLR